MQSRAPIFIGLAVGVLVIGGGIAAYFLVYAPSRNAPTEEPAAEPITALAAPPSQSDVIVSIGREVISYGDFDREWRKMEASLGEPLTAIEYIPVRYAVLAGLVRDRALDLKIKEHGIEVSDEDVDTVAEAFAKEEILAQHPTEEDYVAFLRAEGLDEQGYIDRVKAEVLKDAEGMRREAEVQKLAEDVTDEVTVAADEVEDYFKAVKIRRITISTEPAAADGVTLTDAQAEGRVREIYEELQRGADFADLAKRKSQHPSAADGGLFVLDTEQGPVEYIPRGHPFGPEFDNAAFSTNVGDFSKPFRSDTGWHIIKIEDKKSAPPPDLAERREEYRVLIEQQQKLQYFDNWWAGLPEALGFEIDDPGMKAYWLQTEEGDLQRAIQFYDTALDLAVSDLEQAAINHQESLCYQDLKLADEAMDCMRRVESLADCFQVRFLHGEMHRAQGRKKEALVAFNAAADLVSDVKSIEVQIAYRQELARVFQELGATVMANAERAQIQKLRGEVAEEPEPDQPEEPKPDAKPEPKPTRPSTSGGSSSPSSPSASRPAPKPEPKPEPVRPTPVQPTTPTTAFPTNPYADE